MQLSELNPVTVAIIKRLVTIARERMIHEVNSNDLCPEGILRPERLGKTSVTEKMGKTPKYFPKSNNS